MQHFLIDKITNSIEDAVSGKSVDTEILPVDKADLKTVLKKMVGDLIGKLNLIILIDRYIN
jgi:hypothetical protein